MKYITYQKKYFSSCVKLINDTWHYDQSVSKGASELLLRMKLESSDYKDIIVENNQVIGLFFASKAKKSLLTRLKGKLKHFYNELWLKLKRNKASNYSKLKEFNKDYQKIDTIVEISKEKDIDGEIALFIVSSFYQGKGLGKSLLNRYKEYCIKDDINHVILWTDYECNYKFYNRLGFILYGSFTNKSLVEYDKDEPNGLIYYLEIES